VIPLHHAFLDGLRAQGKLELTGSFSDKSGGAYLLKAATLEEAQALAFSDPVYIANASSITVYEWDAKP